MSGQGFRRVAAPGTDPALLEQVVDQLARRGGAGRLLRAARAHAETAPDVPAAEVLRAVVSPTLTTTVAAVAEAWERLGVRASLVGDPAYPRRLATGWPHGEGPPLLAVRGRLSLPETPTVALVGARRATSYGTGIAAWLADAAATAGITVVSGGAVGIDGVAHDAAVEAGTVVVLGCGHGVAYPRPHASPGGLFDRVLAAGGWMVSEHLPGERPVARHVRSRNRIVAGLADVVVVVEGGERSGALVTAGYAADAGVPVLAVPGDIRRAGSAAPHLLLREGAAPCCSPDDLLAAVGVTTGRRPDASEQPDGATAAPPSTLPDGVRAELARSWPRPLRLDELADRSGLAAAQLLAHLTRARVAGEVAEGADGIRLTRAPGR